MKKIIVLMFYLFALNGQELISELLIVEGDTLDGFVYQVPSLHGDEGAVPLLMAFHQWGGSAESSTYTLFDEEAYMRGWYFMSPFGGASNNYNHQGAQNLWELEILWMLEQFDIDERRIYFAGGSMGGAAGMVYANNHLDPTKPMVAATASASGILDCERRYYEMDGNNSMIEWFGGTPEEVPFEYHRNSAVFFADSTQSMHTNLQYTPLYLDFGATEPHRGHAEDLFDVLSGFNQNMWIETEPGNGHGYSVMDAEHACNWLEQFVLVDDPDEVQVKLDEPSRAYWVEATNQPDDTDFISIDIALDMNENGDFGLNHRLDIQFNNIANTDSIILHVLDQWIDEIYFHCPEDFQPVVIGIDGSFLAFMDTFWVMYGWEPQIYPNPGTTIWINSDQDPLCGDEDDSYGFIYTIDDVSLDGVWNITDIILTIQFILEWLELSLLQQSFADLNVDGEVNIVDIILMVDIILEQ